MGALRDLTGGFTVVWGTLTVLMLAQVWLSALLRPGLHKVE
jgi:CP family cyanate transporter-like MFS transporter